MMDFDPRRAREIASQANTVGGILGSAAEPGVMSGVLSEVPRGVGRGLAAAQGLITSAAEQATQPLYNALESATGVTPANPFGYLRQASDATVRQLAPDPLTVGTAGQIVNSIATIGAEVAAGAALAGLTGGTGMLWGGASMAGGATGRTTYHEMIEKGVDPSTAVNAAFIDGVTTGGGALLPASIGYSGLAEPLLGYGVRLTRPGFVAANAALGAGSNVAIGIAQRGAIEEALRAGGYDTMARQYAPMDGAAMAADGILGGIFSGAGAALNLPARAQGSVDAAMAARDAQHAAVTTAPGIPSDPAAAGAHGKALNQALRDVWDGRAIDVSSTGVQNQAFVFGRRDNTAVNEAARVYGTAPVPVVPSTRLVDIPSAQRSDLRYNAPELNEYAAHVEQQRGLPPGLINALKNAGERSGSRSVSPAGARGVMQFMPENLRKYGVTDPADPVQMIDAAGRYLSDTMRQYGGDVDAVIADYNGGPRAAREVLAGRQPPARETRDYLARVREELGGERAWSQNGPTDGAIQPIPQDRARAARAIEDEIAQAEQSRADLTATAGDAAELGQVRQIQDELVTAQEQRAALDGDATLRDRAKEIQGSGPMISYKQALADAKRDLSNQAADLDARIGRLQDSLDQNRGAAQALQQLAEIDQRIADLQANRASIETPASPFTPVAAALREAGMASDAAVAQAARDADAITRAAEAPAPQVDTVSAAPEVGAIGAGASEPRPPAPAGGGQVRGEAPAPAARQAEAATPRPSVAEGAAPAGAEAGRATDAAGAADDIETRAGLALLEERGDITVPAVDAEGNEVQLSLRQALAEANAELEYVNRDTLDAAVMCQLRGGA